MSDETINQEVKEAAANAAAATADEAPESPVSASETEESAQNKIQADLDRFKDLALRSQADFDNFRKRAAREKEDAIKYANASLLERLIPVLDNFELGLQAAKAEGESSPIYAGMQMVGKQLADFLTDSGVTVVDATGQPFDPNLHQALGQEASAEVPEGMVIRQLRKGYKLRDRLLRPANVFVSRGPE